MTSARSRYEVCVYCGTRDEPCVVLDGIFSVMTKAKAWAAHQADPEHKARIWNTLPVSTRTELIARAASGRSFIAPWLFAGPGVPDWWPPSDARSLIPYAERSYGDDHRATIARIHEERLDS